MGAMVLLRHDTPDGRRHYDWLVQRPGGATAPLAAWRVGTRIDLPGCAEFAAEVLPDHRAVYLEFEGEISGGRGSVARVAAGRWDEFGETPSGTIIRGVWDAGRVRYTGRVGHEGLVFACLPCNPAEESGC